MTRRLARLIAPLAVIATFAGPHAQTSDPLVVLVSFDGWRWDYADRANVPNLRALAARGVRAKELIPSFPSLTFPNHYTIATGLYPQNHGIVENNVFDKGFNAIFTMSKREEVQNGRWWLGEPIWITAEKQGG